MQGALDGDAASTPQDIEVGARRQLRRRALLRAGPPRRVARRGRLPRSGAAHRRHEAACASGSVAVLAAMAELEAGRYDCALVVGVEQMRNVDRRETAAEHLGAAAWVAATRPRASLSRGRSCSASSATSTTAATARRRAPRRASPELNFDNARRNPNAQTRAGRSAPRASREDDERQPGRRGAAAQAGLRPGHRRRAPRWCWRRRDSPRQHAARHGVTLDELPRDPRLGPPHRAACCSPTSSATARDGAVRVPARAAARSPTRFGARGSPAPDELDAIETHDCFTITRVHGASITSASPTPGESWRAIEEGTDRARRQAARSTRAAGCIGGGHPVGATGVRMLLDAAQAGDRRAPATTRCAGARTVATLNIGGSATTVVCFIVGR